MIPRRSFQLLLTGLAILCAASFAFAGSYLVRAALLVAGAERDANQLGMRPTDRELAQMVHRLALSRVQAAREMEVPKEVVPAHPHLLLMLEGHERATDALVRGDQTQFRVQKNKAREEMATFAAVLKDRGYDLPNL